MKLYNTLTKSIEDFKPRVENKIGLYACGPTVYDFAHIGHLRKFTMDDVLICTLRHAGYKVRFVQNITDVGHLTSDGDTGEDKLEKGARKYGQSVWDIAKKFTDHFHRSMKLMGNIEPDVTGVVTDHIQAQLDLVIKLEKKGFAYKVEGDGIYFDTSKFPDYGKMAGLNLKQQKEGVRVDRVEGKRNPADFALWKFERKGENRQMSWPSPWAEKSFPGWHIECSAIGMKYLGEQFDIHTGGIDHIPVHHTNEIAQSEAVTGKSPFVKYWVHHNFLKVDGTKMSKSLGNFYTIDDVLERGFHPLALRLLFLTAHYQSEMNFTWGNLTGAQKSYKKLLKQIIELRENVGDKDKHNKGGSNKNGRSEEANSVANKFFSSLENNLNTAEAVATMWEVVKSETSSNAPGSNTLSFEQKLSLLLEFDEVFNLGFSDAENILVKINNSQKNTALEIPKEVNEILAQRAEARKNDNWDESDKLRNLLLKKGYRVLDSSEGQRLEKI